jgi:hypothetical protein
MTRCNTFLDVPKSCAGFGVRQSWNQEKLCSEMVLFFKPQQCVNLGVFCSGEHHNHALLVVSRLQHCTWYVSLSQNHGDHPLNHLPSILYISGSQFSLLFHLNFSVVWISAYHIFRTVPGNTWELRKVEASSGVESHITLFQWFSWAQILNENHAFYIWKFHAGKYVNLGQAKLQICCTFVYQDLT